MELTANSANQGHGSASSINYYWRPGCPFCMMLERGLKKEGIPLTKHNIWDDAQAAAFVRSVADGNETVPTIEIEGEVLVNPSLRELKATLSAVAPHLLSA